MNEAVITIKLTDSEVNLMVETLLSEYRPNSNRYMSQQVVDQCKMAI